MFDPVADSRNRDVESWGLQDWNTSLFRHFFTSRDSASDVLRLYVTAEELRNVSGAETSSADHVRHAFIDSLKRAIDGRSLGLDADIRAQLWKPKSPVVPPFLSHLLLTCMVANDLADELQSTGDFRRSLAAAPTTVLNVCGRYGSGCRIGFSFATPRTPDAGCSGCR